MDALADHEVVKFIGRDCRALEAGYSVLLMYLCEDGEAYKTQLEAHYTALIIRQEAADNALEDLERDKQQPEPQNYVSDDFGDVDEEERLLRHLAVVQNELASVTADIIDAAENIQEPPMNAKVGTINNLKTTLFQSHVGFEH